MEENFVLHCVQFYCAREQTCLYGDVCLGRKTGCPIINIFKHDPCLTCVHRKRCKHDKKFRPKVEYC